MIVFDLSCEHGHAFEGWFGSSDDFASQKERGLLSCPQCGSPVVTKAPMAPSVPRKGNQMVESGPAGQGKQAGGRSAQQAEQEIVYTGGEGESQMVSNAPITPEVQRALERLAEAQAKSLEKSKWVGTKFADDARAMHYGEQDVEPIHGETSLEEAQQLIDEGIDIAPLPFPVSPPKELN